MTAPTQAPDMAQPGGARAPAVVGWSQRVAMPGEAVLLGARVTGYEAGVAVTFKVFSASTGPDEPLATLEAETGANGVAVATWEVEVDADQLTSPHVLFEASTEESSALSPRLTLLDILDLRMRSEDGGPLRERSLAITDSSGRLRLTRIPDHGRVQRRMPIGEVQLTLKDHLLEGEDAPGQKKLVTGKAHDLTWKRMVYEIDLQSPADGDVFLVGSRLPIEFEVRRAGKVEALTPSFTVSGKGELQEGAGASQQAGKGGGAAGAPVVALGDEEGEVTIEAELQGSRRTITIKAIRPALHKIEVVEDDEAVFPLYDHEEGSPRPGELVLGNGGRPVRSHPTAVKLAARFKVKAWLRHDEQPSGPAKVELALISEALQDKGLPQPSDPAMANKPLTLRLPEDKRTDGVEVSGDWENEPIELEADRELPACVRAHELGLEPRLRVSTDAGWSGPAGAPDAWTELGPRAAPLVVFGVWNKPEVGDGSPKEPGATPVKETELDAFHLRHATRWADGGFHLRPDGDGSILKNVVERIGHYSFPDQYEGKDGQPAGAHQRPENMNVLTLQGIATGERPPQGKQEATESLDVEIRRRGGRGRRSPATDMTVPVVTGGALEVELKLDDEQRLPVRVRLLVDGQQKSRTKILRAGASSGRVDLGPVDPGPHTVTFSPEAAFPTQQLRGFRADATVHFSEPKDGDGKGEDERWGFEVLDHPTAPGGRAHQAVSAMAAALGVLGVKAGVNMIRPREGGAINLVSHDPINRGAPCFDPRKHWGQSGIAFVAVPADDSRDDDPVLSAAKPLHEDGTLVLDPASKRAVTIEEATRTGHARRMPIRDKLVKPQCRCGHAWPAPRPVDWIARVRSGAPFKLKLDPSAKGSWGAVQAGGTYELRYAGNDRFVAQGPHQEERRVLLAAHRISGVNPDKRELSIWGKVFQFDNDGNVTDPQAPDLDVVGQLEADGVPAFPVEDKIERETFPAEVLPEVKVRPRQRLVRERNDVFKRTVSTDGVLRVLVTVPQLPGRYSAAATVLVDGKQLASINDASRGQWVEAPEGSGSREVEVRFSVRGVGPMRGGVEATVTIETSKEAEPVRRCLVCGAQPTWSYKVDGSLKEALIQSIIYPCPKCEATVHEEDADCWACGEGLSERDLTEGWTK